jgi:hypothetical protein
MKLEVILSSKTFLMSSKTTQLHIPEEESAFSPPQKPQIS